MLADNGTAAGSPNPPASCVGVSPRGSSNRASGFPRVSSNDPIQHALVQRSGQDRLQQRPRIAMPQRLDAKLRQSRERVAQLASREHERDPLRQQAAGHERERARRRTIEPLRVIDDTQERPLLGSLGQQAEDRQSDQERIRSRSGAQPEGDAKRVALGIRQTLRSVEDRRAQLLKRRERELHLSLDPDGPQRPATAAPPRPSQSSSAVLPTPGSPCTTRTPPSPPRAAFQQPVERPRARAAGRAAGLPVARGVGCDGRTHLRLIGQ